MDYNEIINQSIQYIVDFFKKEVKTNFSDYLTSKFKNYKIIIKNDRNDYRAAFVNIENKEFCVNKFYCNDLELLLFTVVHELLHILSDKSKSNYSRTFVEEGVVQFLTYKILYDKISQESIKRQYLQDGYRTNVALIDIIYLINKEIIFKYIFNKNGYDLLVNHFRENPQIASGLIFKTPYNQDFSKNEENELQKLIIGLPYHESDIACNTILQSYLLQNWNKKEFDEDNIPLILKERLQSNIQREQLTNYIYKIYEEKGYEALNDITIINDEFEDYNGEDYFDYIYKITDSYDSSKNQYLFNGNIYNVFLIFILSKMPESNRETLKEDLVTKLNITNNSNLHYFISASEQQFKNMNLNKDGFNTIQNIVLKNELIAEQLLKFKDENIENTIEKLGYILFYNYDKYNFIDYDLCSIIFKEILSTCSSIEEFRKKCNIFLNRMNIKENNFKIDPNTLFLEKFNMDKSNYLDFLNLLDTNIVFSSINMSYQIQLATYLFTKEKDITKFESFKHWIGDFGGVDYTNKILSTNYINFIEYYNNGCALINSEQDNFSILINQIQKILEEKLHFKTYL